jgi:heme oxygenase
LLERLRVETRPAHDQIEHALDLPGRMTSRDGYRAVLERFYGFHVAWEAAIEPVIADHAFFHPRRKLDLLVQDLRALGLDDRTMAGLPRCLPLMPLPSPAAAFGAMYVVEGSTLGGSVIARHVERALGLRPEAGCAYFRSYGSATGRMWSAFRTRLMAMSSPGVDDVIVASAQRTFDVMQGWLCEGRAR